MSHHFENDPLLQGTIAALDMIHKAMQPSIVTTPKAPVICITKAGRDKLAEFGVTSEQAIQDLHKNAVDAARYIASGGTECPVCHCTALDGDSITIESGYAWQNVTCTDCGASWTDEYELTGISHFTVGVESTEGGQTIEPST